MMGQTQPMHFRASSSKLHYVYAEIGVHCPLPPRRSFVNGIASAILQGSSIVSWSSVNEMHVRFRAHSTRE